MTCVLSHCCWARAKPILHFFHLFSIVFHSAKGYLVVYYPSNHRSEYLGEISLFFSFTTNEPSVDAPPLRVTCSEFKLADSPLKSSPELVQDKKKLLKIGKFAPIFSEFAGTVFRRFRNNISEAIRKLNLK